MILAWLWARNTARNSGGVEEWGEFGERADLYNITFSISSVVRH